MLLKCMADRGAQQKVPSARFPEPSSLRSVDWARLEGWPLSAQNVGLGLPFRRQH